MLKVIELSKIYPKTARKETLKEELAAIFQKKEKELVPALDKVSFCAEPGELIGIMGHNGAGKSTLLKLLAQVIQPTSGEIHLRGRVGALLEVGAGFHPELSGRENIFLSGAILGMRRKEIESCFDAIAAFAEIEPFLDMPVKKYSSGMFLRLAFSVIAHLDSEILIIDEVLSVADIEFQKKCFEKIKQIARTGRLIFYVSHQEEILKQLCSRFLILERGQIK